MIDLMTPQGFADLMGTKWPELIDAMPRGMGKIMRAQGKVPGTLGMMRPLFPKLLPTMLARISERIPMPEYMQEQMPDMMPRVMDNLMLHMIGDLVPLVTGPMISYLTR